MAGILKVDTIQNANADNIITQTNSTTLTIGASGDTVTLAAGATSSGFGATYNGAVNWDTTKKTSGFTAVSGVGYFADTTSSEFTATLPSSPSAGAIVSFSDYAGTWGTNNLTVGRNGSNIRGSATDLILNVNNQSITLIYVDATEGWNVVQESNNINNFVSATGGTVLTCGDYKTHVFTGPGSFVVSSVGNPSGSTTVEYLVVAGGGGSGGGNGGGGGGAGGYRQNYPSPVSAGLTVTATSYPITVGGGGTAGPSVCSSGNAGDGVSSIFSTITSAGGGGGGRGSNSAGSTAGNSGGSGGGGGGRGAKSGGSGNTPPTSPSQGNNGGTSVPGDGGGTSKGGGGGGAAAVGGNAGGNGGPGGIGSPIATAFFGPTSPSYGTPGPAPGRYFAGAGGGGGSCSAPTIGIGGAGGGGAGGSGNPTPGGNPGVAGTVNTGGGAGGASYNCSAGAAGGSGIVVIRYKFK
jgi:hypothetical protein